MVAYRYSFFCIKGQFIIDELMSIIRQVSWEEFTTIMGNEQFAIFTEKGTVVVLFVTEWSFPSRLALKRIKKMHFNKKRCGIVDVDLVDSIDLVDRYSVTSVPFCLLFREGQQVSHCSGFRVEVFNEIFAPLLADYKAPKTNQLKKCPEGHDLQKRSTLPEEIYPQGYFLCNECRKIECCSNQKPVSHCDICDYDLCVECHCSL